MRTRSGLDERLDEPGGGPLGGPHAEALAFEPALEELALGCLAGAVGALEGDEEAARVFALAEQLDELA